MSIEDERPSKTLSFGPEARHSNELLELIVGYGIAIHSERAKRDGAHWTFAIRRKPFGIVSTH